MYKQSIIIFGMVIPGVLLLLTLGVMWVMLGKFETKRDSRIEALKTSKQNAMQEKALDSRLSSRRGQMEYWDDIFSRDLIQSFNDNLEMGLGHFDSNQLNMAAASQPVGAGVIGKGIEARSSLFKMTFEGGYGPMQELLAELEYRMPQLELQSMNISEGRHTGKGYERSLKFEVTYMAWEK